VSQPVSILLVDDDPTSVSLLRAPLSELGQLRFARSGADGLRLAHARVPDLVLLDVEMPGMSGFDVCKAMKTDPILCDVPIIFITSHDELDQELTGLTLGAADFISKPLRIPLVVARVKTQLTMKAMADALRRAATTDALTGLANRRRFDEMIGRESSRCARNRLPLSLLMIDVDCFKHYNDRYGHPAGDHCLSTVAGAVGGVARRPADLTARYGGEEFCVLLPDTPRDGAALVAQRILQAVDALRLAHATSSVTDHVTVSIGGMTVHATGELGAQGPRHVGDRSADELVAAADAALYAAKHAGRHRVMFSERELAHELTSESSLPRAPSVSELPHA
jgi:diguanylate cyclase (GGDEF)-like protein